MSYIGLNPYKEGDYEAYNSGGVEVEVGEFLQAMVRVLKPQRVLETGCHLGISATYMGMGLRENQKGRLQTIEIEPEHWQKAKELWVQNNVRDYIDLFEGSVDDFKLDGEYDLIFLDTEPAIRFAELVRIFPYLKPGGYVFLHDLPRGFCKGNINPDHPDYVDWPWGPLPDQIKEWLKSGELVKFSFPNPREMAGFYKKKEGDYDATID